ncbi:uncharacterized protein LOC113376872 [Ctenocephalides felis]|uniref:uncharacterized protein LOC113376872 n=1 Tax=Ctenocephalides felis TaxID=7515 RepID=UPI000E6E2E24|nr:uncharacterized protein LOC113376872 [Ctenocephalides felis]
MVARTLASSGYTFDNTIALRLRDRASVKCPPRPDLASAQNISNCNPSRQNSVCLFNLRDDPCETNDLSQNYPYIVKQLKSALVYYRNGLVPQEIDTISIDSIPELYNYTWSNFLDKLPTTDFRNIEL